jgi:ATP-binding cassette, subfamily B, bacterial MsbA
MRHLQLKKLISKALGISENEFHTFLWLIRTYLLKHRFYFLGIWALGIGIVWTTGTVVFMVKPALQASFNNTGPISITLIALVIVMASLLSGIFQYIQTILLEKSGLEIVASLRRDLYNHILHMDISYLSTNHVGELSAICMEETNLIRDMTGNVFVSAIQDAVLFIVLIGIVIYQDWKLSLLALASIPLISLGKSRLSQRRRALTEQLLDSRAKLTAWVSEVLFNARLVKAFGTEETETERMKNFFDQQAKLHLTTLRARSLSQPINEIITGGTIVAVMLVGSWRTESGGTTLPELTAILVALIAAYRPLKRLDNIGNRLQEGASAAVRIKKILDTQRSIQDAPDATPIRVTKGHVQFKNVGFQYAGNKPILHELNFDIAPGSLFAIIGPSGAGKTSLVNLIPRFFDPTTGCILIDEQDIRAVTQASLRSQMAIVTQETLLFDDSIAANIAYGKPDATRDAIITAAKLAAADEFIQALPNGYDTMIGSRGVRLSGGERQRLSIARALLKDTKILVLDEATSALDNKTESLIKSFIDSTDNLPTRIVVAHRLSTIRNADHILVMSEGRIIETGTHETLMLQSGLYAELYQIEEREDLKMSINESMTV